MHFHLEVAINTQCRSAALCERSYSRKEAGFSNKNLRLTVGADFLQNRAGPQAVSFFFPCSLVIHSPHAKDLFVFAGESTDTALRVVVSFVVIELVLWHAGGPENVVSVAALNSRLNCITRNGMSMQKPLEANSTKKSVSIML